MWGLRDDLTADLVQASSRIRQGDIKGEIDLVFLIRGPTIRMSQLLLASSTISELGSAWTVCVERDDLLLQNMETSVSFQIVWWAHYQCILDIHGVGGGFDLSRFWKRMPM